FMGAHLAATRMHKSIEELFHGWARIFSGTSRRSPWRIVLAIGFACASMLSVYPALAWGIHQASSDQPAWLLAALVHFVLMTSHLMLVYFWSGNPPSCAWLLPFSCPMLLAIFGYSVHKCRTGRIFWRGMHCYPAPSSTP